MGLGSVPVHPSSARRCHTRSRGEHQSEQTGGSVGPWDPKGAKGQSHPVPLGVRCVEIGVPVTLQAAVEHEALVAPERHYDTEEANPDSGERRDELVVLVQLVLLRPKARQFGMPSDCTRQSATVGHGHKGDHTAGHIWGGTRLRSEREMATWSKMCRSCLTRSCWSCGNPDT